MLFLLNDTVLDIGVPADTLVRVGGPSPLAARLIEGVRAGQAALFAAGSFQNVNSDVALRVAAEIAVTSPANAALFVRPDRVRHPSQVAVRLVSAPLTTLAALQRRQEALGVDPAHINAAVWNLAQATTAA